MAGYSRDGTLRNLRSSTSVSHQRDALACASWDRGYETIYASSDLHPGIFLSSSNHFTLQITAYLWRRAVYCSLTLYVVRKFDDVRRDIAKLFEPASEL